jgi:hypothetical protein
LRSFFIVIGHELTNDEFDKLSVNRNYLAQRGNEERRIGALFPLSVPNEETPHGVSGTTDVH